ncbi:MAG: ribonuclease Y [Myxococcales bacterium]|nr:ribonuclease Y [Myxococcales bacterium]MCB9531710.1 ribonuclease Y [Myxococcales bacterium]
MEIVIGVIALVVGVAAGFAVGAGRAKKAVESYQSRAEEDGRARAATLTATAEGAAEKLRAQAEADAAQIRTRAERDAERANAERRAEIEKVDLRLSKREEKLDERASELDHRLAELSKEEKEAQRLSQSIADKQRNVDSRLGELQTRLAEIAGLSRDEARAQIIESVTEQARLDAAKAAREIEESALEEAEKRAKKVLAVTIQRYAGEYVAERTVSVVNLPSDEMKGRIIGREGRNIRALEAATGVDFIVDDTPEAIIVSAFDPVRREIARLSLERLMADGRIHPSRIEEIVAKTTKEVDKICKEAGEQAAFELGITGLHPEIIRFMGRLKYRTSYGQNIWAHSIEVGFLCGLMAGELGLNVKLARRAGFLHDIGKAMDQSDEGGHAIVGANFIKKYGEDELIVNAVGAHHEEIKPASVIAHLVIAADALSGARPGARREVLESYVKRLEDLERISMSFPGVEKSFAVQAGREVRVIVANERVSDEQASMLSRDIARKIEQDLTYPGQIRVTVIRELRATEVAR